LLVAAREANGLPCYPGALPGVLGVQLDWDCPRNRYRVTSEDGTSGIFVSGYPRPIPGVSQQRNLYGISFATAQMSGFAALAYERAGKTSQGAGRFDVLQQTLLNEATA
jgi:hypothetical protein